nr:9552_t:CDS:10 [Entrophospora candida]
MSKCNTSKQTLKEHRVAGIEIENIRNVYVNEWKSYPSQSESRNKRTTIDLNNQSESDSEWYYEDSVEKTKLSLENYNIICLFDVEFPYTKQLFKKLPMDQMCMIKNKWSEAEEFISKKEIEECWNECSLKKLVDDNHRIIKESGNEDLNSLITPFTKQQFNKYEHRQTYELFWCQDFYTRIHSALLDSSSSEYQYRDEIVNILLASIFYDVEDALWIKTLGDKHDGILYMNVCGVNVGVGFIEVVGNAFNTITSDKNDDLEKLLKAMTISLWYQYAHQSNGNTSKLQLFAVLLCGREFRFLSMHLIGDMYVVDEYDAFVIPDSGLNLLHVGDIVKIVKKFKVSSVVLIPQRDVYEPRIVTRHTISGLPTASQEKSK